MKTRAELAEDLCKAVDKWFSPPHDGDNVAITPVLAALIAWRVKPTDPPLENKWCGTTFNALQMMKDVRDYKLTIEKAITDLASEITYCRGLLEPKITTDLMNLSDKLSEEEVWLRAVVGSGHEGWGDAVLFANYVSSVFHQRFRKESK
jgi:hypothetical protein